MKARVMRRAWELAREGQKNFGGSVKMYFAESLRIAWREERAETKDQMIERLEGLGFKRWTKYGKDRMYIDATDLGLTYGKYSTGNIHWAKLGEYSISNASCRRLLSAKTYLDLATMKFYSDNDELKELAQNLANIAA